MTCSTTTPEPRIATIFLDDDLRITRFTPAAAALFNVRESDRGRPFRDLAPRFVEEDVLGDVRSVLTSAESVERRAHRSDGSAWYLVRMMPHRRLDATATGLGVTFVDITALVQAEEAERRYVKLLQFSPDAVFAWRLDGGIETWNRGAEELYGFSPAEAMGKAPRDLLRAIYPRPWAEVEAALREHERWQGEVESRGADGRALVVMATLSLLLGEDGVRRVLQSDRDITQRKAQAAERERLIEILRESDRRKNEFLAILSHELRNPLAPIRNSLFILDRAVPTGEQAQRARAVIGRQVTQLTRIVDDLLDVTRIARAKLPVQRARLDVGDLLRRTVEDHRTIFVDAGVDVEIRADERPVWVNGDSARLAQAIGNVLSNAAKFTRRGGHVLVTLEQDVRRMVAVIRIRDDGAGMSPDLLERVFEPFAQADATLDRSRGGLGLGLAIVKGVIEQHEGDVEARSDGIGQGAEFTIHLPLLVEAEPVGAAIAGLSPLRSPRRVLVIEDNVDAAESLREALELMEHQVAVAYDGADGLKKAREFRPDVVLCDVGLPVKSGYEVARDLRADETLRSVWLVALTGYGLAEDIALVREVGFDQHLVKPVSMEKLAYVLEARARNADDDPARRR